MVIIKPLKVLVCLAIILTLSSNPSGWGTVALTSRAVSRAMPCPLNRLRSLIDNTVLQPSP